MIPSNLFENLSKDQGGLDQEVFETLVRSNSLEIERIISRGHSSPESGWYDQSRHEWVVVLKGEAVLSFDGESDVRLQAGDHVNIPAHTRHRVAWTRPDGETVWLAVHYD